MPGPRSAKRSSKRSGGPDFAVVHAHLQALFHDPHRERFGIGTILVRVHDQKLFRQGDVPTFHAYLDSLTAASRRTWQRYMALARQVDPLLAFMVPGDRLELALRLFGAPRRRVYLSAAMLQALQIDVLRYGHRMKVSFEDATDEELAAAVVER